MRLNGERGLAREEFNPLKNLSSSSSPIFELGLALVSLTDKEMGILVGRGRVLCMLK